MGRLGTFLIGFVLGGATVYTSLHYHVIRAGDGFHMVPKMTSTFAESYVDVRAFGFQEWNEHRELAFAITKAGKTYLLQGVAPEPLQDAVDNMFDMVNGQRPGQPF